MSWKVNLIEAIDTELSQPVINMPLAAMYTSRYLELGEYAAMVETLNEEKLMSREEESELLFTFLWMILVAEGEEE